MDSISEPVWTRLVALEFARVFFRISRVYSRGLLHTVGVDD